MRKTDSNNYSVLSLRFRFFSNFRMSPRLFSPDMESMLLEQYEDVRVKASGSTLRVAEKYALIGTGINF